MERQELESYENTSERSGHGRMEGILNRARQIVGKPTETIDRGQENHGSGREGVDIAYQAREILGMRTAADIFEEMERNYEEERAQREPARRRTRTWSERGAGESRGSNGPRPKQAKSVRQQRRFEDGVGETCEARTVVGQGTSDNEGRPQEEEGNDEELREAIAATIRRLQGEFEEKERLSSKEVWCEPIPLERMVSTVCDFYSAFHDGNTLATNTCTICYLKFGKAELSEVNWDQCTSSLHGEQLWQFRCRKCFPPGLKVLACKECVGDLAKGRPSAAARLHYWLGCEHEFPEELDGLTPVEEKLIALNSCYGFITRYSIPQGSRQNVRYPKHVKGHITVFPNNVEELATKVLPHPLVKLMDEIHVSWQGATRPAPEDLSSLLSVRRVIVEKALRWLKQHNPLYADIEINVAEMESWGELNHGVPDQVYERLERNEPSAWEKTRTAQIVPQTERGLEEAQPVDIREVVAALTHDNEEEEEEEEEQEMGEDDYEGEGETQEGDGSHDTIQEISSSGMFALDGGPHLADAEMLQYAYNALHHDMEGGGGISRGSARVDRDRNSEAYIAVSRGEDFADSGEFQFFAKTFPTLFPLGRGGPRQSEEHTSKSSADPTSSFQNLGVERWARLVLQRHGGRFSSHHVFSFLVFNMLVKFRNSRVAMMSLKRKNFEHVEAIVRSLDADQLDRARVELELTGKTTNDKVRQLLQCLTHYGYRQPMSAEARRSMRRKIKSLIIRLGIPAIWFTINPNDITNPVKLKLAAYRTRETGEAERFLASLDRAYKRARLAISDPISSVMFFHRELSMFFEKYVRVGEPSVFGRINDYFGAVETNERGSLHFHGMLWLHGNMRLSEVLDDLPEAEGASYRERIAEYVDSVFTEELDMEAFSAVNGDRSVTSDISSNIQNREQFAEGFDEEANFCAGTTQIHTHTATCVKYSLGKSRQQKQLCRFKAPWKLVEKTALTEDGVLQVRRNHSLVNRWNKSMAVGLRHNHDISFIGTQSKTMALVYYITNYTTKVEDPIWKRVAAAAEVFKDLSSSQSGSDGGIRTRQFLCKVANRVFTDRALSQVEVISHLLGYKMEYTHNPEWMFINASGLYWQIFRRWSHLQRASGSEIDEAADETVLVQGNGQRLRPVQAYPHRGELLRSLCLYDYLSIVKFKRKTKDRRGKGEIEFASSWEGSQRWVQVLRRPGKQAHVCVEGYLAAQFSEDDESWYRRAAVQHLGLFVPWEQFLCETSGDMNDIWEMQKRALSLRLLFIVENIQLLRRSAEDAKRDARQWAAISNETVPDLEGAEDCIELGAGGCDEDEVGMGRVFKFDEVGRLKCLLKVLSSAVGSDQITAGSRELWNLAQQLCGFQQADLSLVEWLVWLKEVATFVEQNSRTVLGGRCAGSSIPNQEDIPNIKKQQRRKAKERENMIQGIREPGVVSTDDHRAAVYSALNGFGEEDVDITEADSETTRLTGDPSINVRIGQSTSFDEAGKQIAESLTLNRRQRIALRLVCRQLDRVRSGEPNLPQHLQFVGGEGGTGKSRVIEAIIKLFESKGRAHRLLVTAMSGTAAAVINGITIHSACNFSKNPSSSTSSRGSDQFDTANSRRQGVNGRIKMDWAEKDMLIIDEVSMLGGRTLHAVNKRLCELRGSEQDFGGIPIVLFSGDFRQFGPVQDRSILLAGLPSPSGPENSSKAEQRFQHEAADKLWEKFTKVVVLKEQVRAAGDPRLQQLLKKIRRGEQDQTDVDFLNDRCYQEGRRIPWESGITVVTPLNRNRWNLNAEAALAFQGQHEELLRIFMSEHKWETDGEPTEEEAALMLGQGDDSSVPIPAVFMFVAGMPVVVNHNTYQGLKVVNGARYKGVEVIIDNKYPGYRVSSNTIIHFGPPAGILLEAESTEDFEFVGMPSGTVLLTPMTVQIEKQPGKRPWQTRKVARKGLPCTAAFACTDYKVQARTLAKVALELRGKRSMTVNGQREERRCDPYSLYVQLSRCTSLDGIMLVSKAREVDFVGNTFPENMVAAESRLEVLCEKTIQETEEWESQS